LILCRAAKRLRVKELLGGNLTQRVLRAGYDAVR
jgi:hypothetical protein